MECVDRMGDAFFQRHEFMHHSGSGIQWARHRMPQTCFFATTNSKPHSCSSERKAFAFGVLPRPAAPFGIQSSPRHLEFVIILLLIPDYKNGLFTLTHMLRATLMVLLLASLAFTFKTEARTQITPLEQLLTIDATDWTCDKPSYREWKEAQRSFDQWIDIMKHKDGFDGDLQVLAMVKQLVDGILATVQHLDAQKPAFLQIKRVHTQISKHMRSLSLIENAASWYDIQEVLEYVEVLNKAKTNEDKLQIAQKVAAKIAELISQISDIQYQLSQTTVDIDWLYDQAAIINDGADKCQEAWAPLIEAEEKARLEELRKQAEAEQAEEERREAERIAQEEAAEKERERLEKEAAEEEERRRIREGEFGGLTADEIEELEKKAEQEIAEAEEQVHDAEHEVEEAEEREAEAKTQAQLDEEAAAAAAEAAKAAEEAALAAEEKAKDSADKEQEACLDKDEAERRLQEALKAEEEAKKRAEEAAKAAELARQQETCDEPQPDPVSESSEETEESSEELVEESSEEDCNEKELEKLIDTLIDSATTPQAFTPGCGYPGCEQQPIIIIVEDDEDDPKPQPGPEPKPKSEPVPDDVTEDAGETEEITEEVTIEDVASEEESEEEEEKPKKPTPEPEESEEEEETVARTGFTKQELEFHTPEIYPHGSTNETEPWGVDVDHDPSKGTRIEKSDEFFYGLWTYFRFNGDEKVFDKEGITGISVFSTDGEDRLQSLIGSGEYIFRAYDGDKEDDKTVDYGVDLDGEWVYIHYGYKVGTIKGYIYWSSTKRLEEVEQKVTFPLISKKVTFKAGTAGKKYTHFNGKVAFITVKLTINAFLETKEKFQEYFEKTISGFKIPEFDLQYVEERRDEKKEPDDHVEDPSGTWDFDGYREYSVATWFRYIRIPGYKQVHVIYRLTSNEDVHLSNKMNHGDRALTLFQDDDETYHFDTYTVEPKDKVVQIKKPVEVSRPTIQTWKHAYFGYKWSKGKGVFRVTFTTLAERKTLDFEGKHYLAKFWAFYLGRDKYHSFTGKTAFAALRFGPGAFSAEGDFEYDTGRKVLLPGLVEREFEAKTVAHDNESEYELDVHQDPEFMIDGAYSFGFGLWTKFFMTNPRRIYDKPERLLIAKLALNPQESQEPSEFGAYIGRGSYVFVAPEVETPHNVPYATELDGHWNYIYYSYNKLSQGLNVYLTFDSSKKTWDKQTLDFDISPMNNYTQFYVGQYKDVFGFNGKISGAILRIGPGADIDSVVSYTEWFEAHPAPEDQDRPMKRFEILEDEDTVTASVEKFVYEDEATETKEYSVFGWFKYYGSLALEGEEAGPFTLIRLTNNEDDHLEDTTRLGDRTLTAIQNGDGLTLATYTIGTIDDNFDTNVNKTVPLSEYRGIWMYIWLGYSRNHKTFGWFLGFPDISKAGIFKHVVHFSPKYLAIHFGKDGINKEFNGKSRHVAACYGGSGCFHWVDKPIEEEIPNWLPYKLNNKFEFFIENDDGAEIRADGDNAAIDVEISSEKFPGADIEAIYEYGVGLWTRWLMNYPFILLEKAPSHSIFRLTTNVEYGDEDKAGDRTLAVFVGRNEYQFITYDVNTNNNAIGSGIKYDFELEGYWSFIYFSYKRFPEGPRGVGQVFFTNLGLVKRVEVESAKNWLMRDKARLVVGKKEFAHSAFQGKLFDVRVFLGSGAFVEGSEELLDGVIPKFRKAPPYKEKQDNEPVFVEKAPVAGRTFKAYEEKYSGVFEYSVYGFAKGLKVNVTELTTLVRVTQNTPDIQDDNTWSGDRTFAIHVNQESFIYSTYDYGDLETIDDDDGDLVAKFDYQKKLYSKWTYFYFGYSFKLKQAYAYIRYYDQTQNSFLFEDCHHFVPHYLSVFFADDGYYKQYQGEAFDWYLGIGDGAFTTDPQPREWPVDPIPPPDRILSALLANQGVNSGRLLNQKL